MGHSLNRRAAIIGAVVSAGALAVPVAAAVRPTTMQDLVDKFQADCMALDPSITKAWVYYDELMDGPRDNRVMCVQFERASSPFIRDPGAEELGNEWWRKFSALTKQEKLEYAKILRGMDRKFARLADRIERIYA